MQTELATIIPIAEQHGKNTVNARQLHAFLEVKKDFSNWIKLRIKQFSLTDGRDFVVTSEILGSPELASAKLDSPKKANQKTRGGDRRSIEYHLTIETAKELSMVQNNARGKEVREYFIACEESLRAVAATPALAIPTTLSAALRLAADKADEAEALKLVVKEQAPAVEFLGKYVEATGQFGFSACAKMLGVPPRRFFALCAEHKVIFKDGFGDWVPYQQWIEAGYCTLKTGMAHEKHAFKQARLTSKGLPWVTLRLGLNAQPSELGLMDKAG